MKMQAEAIWRKLLRIISEKAVLFVTVLFARFIEMYLTACRWYCEIPQLPIFNNTYALKRAYNRSVHHRKFALFPCSGGHGLIT